MATYSVLSGRKSLEACEKRQHNQPANANEADIPAAKAVRGSLSRYLTIGIGGNAALNAFAIRKGLFAQFYYNKEANPILKMATVVKASFGGQNPPLAQ